MAMVSSLLLGSVCNAQESASVSLSTTPPSDAPMIDTPSIDASSADASSTDAPTPEATQDAPASTSSSGSSTKSRPQKIQSSPEDDTVVVPWDYDPYRVLVWVAFDDPRQSMSEIEPELRAFLDRDFAAIWRLTVADAPSSIHALMERSMQEIDYDSMTASDPVLAVKRDHKDSVRIRTANNVGEFVTKIMGSNNEIKALIQRGKECGNGTLNGIASRLEPVEDTSKTLAEIWENEEILCGDISIFV